MRSGSLIVVDAKPDALTLDAALTTVIVVDMQNDFGAPGAMFALAGIDIAPIRAVIPPTAVAVAAARRAGMAIIYLKMAFKPDLSDAEGDKIKLSKSGSADGQHHMADVAEIKGDEIRLSKDRT